MITVEELKKKALQRYPDFIDNYCNQTLDTFFPLVIPCNKGNPNDDFEKRSRELKEIHEHSKNNGKKSYIYETSEVSSRTAGKQTVITKIYFDDISDYLVFINKKAAFEVLEQAVSIINDNLRTNLSKDEITSWIIKNNEKLSDKTVEDGIDTYWKNICLCANWLFKNPRSNLYIRTIPLEVHSKFIENNQTIIHTLISSEKITKENSFIKQHGLSEKPNHICFRFLDTTEISKNFAPKELIITSEDFTNLEKTDFMKNIKSIFIVENEMIYLSFPEIKNAICIWGHGFTAGHFKQFSWLNNFQLYYFGDLDEHGYEILSIFRTAFPGTKSICMNIDTLNKFDRFRVAGEVLTGGYIPEKLNEDELLVFNVLRKDKKRNRLEQERISQGWIINSLLSLHIDSK